MSLYRVAQPDGLLLLWDDSNERVLLIDADRADITGLLAARAALRMVADHRNDLPPLNWRAFLAAYREATDERFDLDDQRAMHVGPVPHAATPDPTGAPTVTLTYGDLAALLSGGTVQITMDNGRIAQVGTTMRVRGAIIPQAVGSDWNCGMRVHRTSLTGDQVRANRDALARHLRAIFFGGERAIGLTAEQRLMMLTWGIQGLLYAETFTGDDLTRTVNELEHINGGGGVFTSVSASFMDYVRGNGGDEVSYDSQIGSLGGGNHFLEIQEVTEIQDGAAAYAWGLRPGQVVIMVHTGSLGLGHVASRLAREMMRAILPRDFELPENGLLALPLGANDAATVARETARAASRVATNFAYANRFYLARMAERALREAVAEPAAALLWDAPHNLLWEDDGTPGVITHRKGSTPARGPEAMQGTPFAYWGEPVIVPGSMGDASVLLRGLGNPDALESACHGAGRALRRGEAAQGHDADLDAFLRDFTVVTSVDSRALAARPDMLRAWREQLAQEAPHAYKAVGPAVETLRDAGVAAPVATLRPLLTVKG